MKKLTYKQASKIINSFGGFEKFVELKLSELNIKKKCLEDLLMDEVPEYVFINSIINIVGINYKLKKIDDDILFFNNLLKK